MGESVRVLVVDDDPAMCAMLVDSLESRGHGAVSAHGVTEALGVLDTQSFTLVVTDLHMDSRGGFDLLDALRERPMAVPVVLMSSFGSPEVIREATARGALAFLSKPFDPEELMGVLRRVLNGEGSGRR